jgi:hypothetical protein
MSIQDNSEYTSCENLENTKSIDLDLFEVRLKYRDMNELLTVYLKTTQRDGTMDTISLKHLVDSFLQTCFAFNVTHIVIGVGDGHVHYPVSKVPESHLQHQILECGTLRAVPIFFFCDLRKF